MNSLVMKKPALFVSALLIYLFMLHNSLGFVVDTVSFNGGDLTINVEVAQSAGERAKGLMYREGISEESGMLFIFDSEDKHSFWMKNMSFPIDIIWIDSNFRIVDITMSAVPCMVESCTMYSPGVPARYVLEVQSDFVSGNGVEFGDVIGFVQSGREE
jgi:uncharacterized membrane protein (UPF0127 family)